MIKKIKKNLRKKWFSMPRQKRIDIATSIPLLILMTILIIILINICSIGGVVCV